MRCLPAIAMLLAVLSPTAASADAFTLCKGERAARAPAHCPGAYDIFVHCGDIQEEARQTCTRRGAWFYPDWGHPNVVVLNYVRGPICGYGTYRVICE
jgi:hypothetical protein